MMVFLIAVTVGFGVRNFEKKPGKSFALKFLQFKTKRVYLYFGFPVPDKNTL